MTIFELNRKVQAFDLQTELDKIIIKNENVFVDANTEMLFSGKDASGKGLGEYSPKTVEYKKAKGDPYDRITLKDEGDYYTGKNLVKDGNDFTIKSTDWKNDKLETDFGMDINGIDSQRMSEITDDILSPQLTKSLQNVIS